MDNIPPSRIFLFLIPDNFLLEFTPGEDTGGRCKKVKDLKKRGGTSIKTNLPIESYFTILLSTNSNRIFKLP